MNRVRKQIHYSRAEQEQLTGYHIGIGVLDSGIFPHEDLKDQIRAFRDFTNKYQLPYDETGHGTHVCGILAGNGRVLHGKYKGMAPYCDLYVGKILDKKGEGSLKTLLRGLEWLLSIAAGCNIHIINISVSSIETARREEQKRLYDLFHYAYENNILIVTAAGNFGPGDNTISRLGDTPYVICVGCHDGDLENGGLRCQDCSGRGPGENVWKKPDIVAPGTQIISCQAAYGKYVARSGTSMATPIVSGLLALAWEKYPYLNAMQLKRKLILSATDLGESYLMQGAGMVDVEKMLS